MVVIAFLLPLSVLSSYTSVLKDTFTSLDNWEVEIMPGYSSGNNEWEYYTDSPRNVFLSSNENGTFLGLRAQHDSVDGYNYSSGKVHSKLQYGPYGFFNVRAVVPKGKALWPAIWLLPEPPQSRYGGWAASGEIDIMETICDLDEGYSTLHFGGPWPNQEEYPVEPNNKYPFTPDWSNPHWYGMEWTENFIQFWYDAQVVDGKIEGTVISYIPSNVWYSKMNDGTRFPQGAPFDKSFNILMNLAVGGDWPCRQSGCCDSAAVPAQMEIYEVDVWQLSNEENLENN